MELPEARSLKNLVTLFLAWIETTEWESSFDSSMRVLLGIPPRVRPDGMFAFLRSIPDEYFAQTATLVVEDFIANDYYGGKPLREFLHQFAGELDYWATDWVTSLPGTQLRPFEILADDGVWVTFRDVLRPDFACLADPASIRPYKIGDIRLDRIVETELSPRRSTAGFPVPEEIWGPIHARYRKKCGAYESPEDKERMGRILVLEIVGAVVTAKLYPG